MKEKRYYHSKKQAKVNEPVLAYPTEKMLSVHSILDVAYNMIADPLNRIETFRKGLQKKSFEKLKSISGLDYNTLAGALGVSSKTLQRKEIFDVVQSEKMYEVAELYALGISYFGEEGFRRWMERPLFSLGNRYPIDLIDVSEGISLLKTEIMRLQHGIVI